MRACSVRTTSSKSSAKERHWHKGETEARPRRSGTSPRRSESGSSAGCGGSSLQMLLDARNVFLDRELRLERVGPHSDSHDQEGFPATVDDQVLARPPIGDHPVEDLP